MSSVSALKGEGNRIRTWERGVQSKKEGVLWKKKKRARRDELNYVKKKKKSPVQARLKRGGGYRTGRRKSPLLGRKRKKITSTLRGRGYSTSNAKEQWLRSVSTWGEIRHRRNGRALNPWPRRKRSRRLLLCVKGGREGRCQEIGGRTANMRRGGPG